MSKELDTNLLGVTRSPSESCDERGKRLKLESEPESESEPEQELESDSEEEDFPYWDYTTKPYEDLVYEDFSSRYDDNPHPYFFGCSRFSYRNKAQIKKDEEEAKALADYLRDSASLSPFDAIPVPPLANVCGNKFPKPITTTMDDNTRALLAELSKISLEKYNHDQGSKYVFHNLVKACRCCIPLITYYITFEAKDVTHVDPSSSPPITFQAHVWDPFAEEDGPPVVESCSIKT